MKPMRFDENYKKIVSDETGGIYRWKGKQGSHPYVCDNTLR